MSVKRRKFAKSNPNELPLGARRYHSNENDEYQMRSNSNRTKQNFNDRRRQRDFTNPNEAPIGERKQPKNPPRQLDLQTHSEKPAKTYEKQTRTQVKMNEQVPMINVSGGFNGHNFKRGKFSKPKLPYEQEADKEIQPKETENNSVPMINKDFSSLPIGELLALKEKLDTQLYNKLVLKQTTSPNDTDTKKYEKKRIEKKVFKRENKKRPREMPAKAPPSKMPKQIFDKVPLKGLEKRDPRFDQRCGEYDDRVFRQTYTFLKDVKDEERSTLKEALDEAQQNGDSERINALKHALKIMNDADRNAAELERERELKRQLRSENVERLKQGKEPVYLSRAKLKQRIFDTKMSELNQQGKMNKYLRKREKRQKGKGGRREMERQDLPTRLKISED